MNPTANPESKSLTAFESQSHRRPISGPSASDGNGEGSPDKILEAALGACLKHLHDSSTWRGQVMAALDTIGHTTLATAEGLQAVTRALARLETAREKDASTVAVAPLEIMRLEAQLEQLVRVIAAQTHNLEQVRLQTEALARNFEKLSQEVILRQVMDPFFVALARLYEGVFALSGRERVGDEDLQLLLNRIRGLLEDHNIEIIHPDNDDPFDPRRHQPVRRVCSADAAMHGRIASTFNIGLVHDQRLIQPARVEVFIFADATSADAPKP